MPPPSKKRKTSVVEEITFDPAARQEYLSGFHKRKQARIKHAQEQAKKKEREERVEERKKLREERKADVERHVQEMNALMKEANGVVDEEEDGEDGSGAEGEDKEWTGFEEPSAINHEDEYVDEDKYTTVTVESVSISRDGFDRAEDESEEGLDAEDDSGQVKQGNASNADEQSNKRRIWTKEKPKTAKPKKKKKFRYEAPAERKASRMRERSKGKEQAKARRAAK